MAAEFRLGGPDQEPFIQTTITYSEGQLQLSTSLRRANKSDRRECRVTAQELTHEFFFSLWQRVNVTSTPPQTDERHEAVLGFTS